MSSPSKSSLLVQASDKGALISENASADIFAPRSPTQVSAADQECIGTLTDLVDAIDRTFATAESRVRLHECLGSIMKRTNLSVECIKKYSHFCDSKPYSRQRVKCVDGQYELLVLCWNPGMGSKIHDHPGDGCYVRLIEGKLEETLYRVVDSQDTLELYRTTTISAPAVTYMDDNLGVHRLANPDAEVGAISLHLYTPPTVRCKIWDSDAAGTLPRQVELSCNIIAEP